MPFEVDFPDCAKKSLGIAFQDTDQGVMIGKIDPNSETAANGKLKPGLVLIGVFDANGRGRKWLNGIDYADAMDLLKAKKKRGFLKLHFSEPGEGEGIGDGGEGDGSNGYLEFTIDDCAGKGLGLTFEDALERRGGLVIKQIMAGGLADKRTNLKNLKPGLLVVGIYGGKGMRGRALKGLDYEHAMTLMKNKIAAGVLKLQCDKPPVKKKRKKKVAVAAAPEPEGPKKVDLDLLSEEDVHIYEKFMEFDDDDSGYLDHDEVKTFCKKLGLKLTDEQVGKAIKRMEKDGNGDGLVEFAEFLVWWKSDAAATKKGTISYAIANARDKAIKKELTGDSPMARMLRSKQAEPEPESLFTMEQIRAFVLPPDEDIETKVVQTESSGNLALIEMNEMIDSCDDEEAADLISEIHNLDVAMAGGDLQLMKNMLYLYYSGKAVEDDESAKV